MSKRSFTKEKDLMYKKDFMKSKAIGGEFGSNKGALSGLGKSIINKFIEDNEKKTKVLISKENVIEEYRRSKPLPYINPWKNSNHIIGEFSTPPADQVHSFKKEKLKNFLLKDPFYRPSDYGKYFEKLNIL
jgi:hypothetical protein